MLTIAWYRERGRAWFGNGIVYHILSTPISSHSPTTVPMGDTFRNEKYFWTRKNTPCNYNALRGSNLPTYIIDDKFYLEHTKVVLNRLWGSERGIYGLEIHYAAHKRYLSYTSVTLWEALKSVFGIRAKGFILWGIKRQYRGRRAAVFIFITERV